MHGEVTEAHIIGGDPERAQRIVDALNNEARKYREQQAALHLADTALTNRNGAGMDPLGEDVPNHERREVRQFVTDI